MSIQSESASIVWINGPDVPEQHGFTQEQLIIYKLGTIESQITTLLAQVSSSSTEAQKMVTKLQTEHDALKDNVTKLEKRFDAAQNKFIAIAAAVSFAFLTLKGLIFKWLNIS